MTTSVSKPLPTFAWAVGTVFWAKQRDNRQTDFARSWTAVACSTLQLYGASFAFDPRDYGAGLCQTLYASPAMCQGKP